jgi:hypothetical protein
MPDHDHDLLSPLRSYIQGHASSLGCLEQAERLTDLHAVRLIQEREGNSPCFGREGPPCDSNDCFWLEACANYRSPTISPLDKEFPTHERCPFDRFRERLEELERQKKATLSPGEVGLKIRSYRNLAPASRKMLVAAPKTVVCENPEEAPLKPYILSHQVYRLPASYPHGRYRHDLQVLFTSDLPALSGWLAETSSFQEAGNLSYYPLVQSLSGTREITPKFSRIQYIQNRIPVIGLPGPLDFGATFSAPHLGLADGDIMLSDRSYSPILNLDLPVLENIDYAQLYKLMADHPEELCAFRDFLQARVEEMREAALGSEQFARECRKIERQIRDQLRKLNSDYKKARLTTAFSLTGCAVATWTLALYCILQGSGDVLSFLGPGGALVSASAALSNHLVKRLDLKDNPAYFLWVIGRSKRP